MARDWFESFGNPEAKATIVERVLRERGIDPITPAPLPPIPKGKPLDPPERTGLWFDDFVDVDRGFPVITRTLAAQLHYAGPAVPRELSDGSGQLPDDGEGYEGLRR